MRPAILIADDEPYVRESLAAALRGAGHRVETAADGAAALAALECDDFALVLADVALAGADGRAMLARVRAVAPNAIVVLMTAQATVESAIEALGAGAADYVLKPVACDDVLGRVGRALEHRRLMWEAQHLRTQAEAHCDVEGLVGASAAMTAVLARLAEIASRSSAVLLTGECGSGTEVVARALHRTGATAHRLFVPVDCAALPEAQLERELFGHVRGTSDGAAPSHEGLFTRVRGGTIFFDEIGDLPLGVQERLLRVIATREVLPIGGTEPVPVDARIVAASSRDLRAMAAAGAFREDLAARLATVAVALPPLRDRREDIPALVEHLVRRHNRAMKRAYRGADDAALAVLVAQPWKDDVRELDNAIAHAMIVGDGEWLRVDDLPRRLQPAPAATAPPAGDDLRATVRFYEREHIETVLRRLNGDKRTAAGLLGVSLSSLYRKLDELGIGLGMPRG
jgi:DNA-binding NtrC family response regulator